MRTALFVALSLQLLVFSPLFSPLFSPMAMAQEVPMGVALSHDERAYLERKAALRVCIDPDWMPIERLSADGRYEGISSEYISRIADKISTPITVYPTQSWTETVAAAKSRRCDLVSLMNSNPAREVFLDFTKPFLSYSYVIVTQNGESYIDDLAEYPNKTFTIVKGYHVGQLVRNAYPMLNVQDVENTTEGLKLVEGGAAFGHIDTSIVQTYTARVNGFSNLTINGSLPWKSNLSMAMRNDEPLLQGIVARALASIAADEKQRIENKWVAVTVEKVFDLEYFLQLIFTAGVVVILLVCWAASLRASNIRLEKAHVDLTEMMDEQKQFMMMLSHEFKNPLASIGRSAEMLDQNPDLSHSGNLARIENIKDRVGVLQRLVNTFLRHEGIKTSFENDRAREVSLRELWDQTAHYFDKDLIDKRVRVTCREGDAVLFCDVALLASAMSTILDNALKYSTRGAAVHVLLENRESHLEVEVSDRGIGISPEDLEKIPTRFYRAQNVRSHPGSGLGLSVAQKIIQNHQGQMTIKSTIGEGTTVIVRVPVPSRAVS